MKKLLSVILMIVLAISLSGCDGEFGNGEVDFGEPAGYVTMAQIEENYYPKEDVDEAFEDVELYIKELEQRIEELEEDYYNYEYHSLLSIQQLQNKVSRLDVRIKELEGD